MINKPKMAGEKERAVRCCDYHLSHPDIFVMQAAEEWDSCERSNCLRPTAKRGVLVESQMSANAIVIVGVGAEDPA
jgi:hypothetical protein